MMEDESFSSCGENRIRFSLKSFESFSSCGENRIRTCEPVLPVTRFPGVPLQPLEHLSFNKKGTLNWLPIETRFVYFVIPAGFKPTTF